MAKKQLRTDNHYVPKLYLKQWATDGKIPTYRLLVPHENMPLWKNLSLKGIAFHQNLYTYLTDQDPTDEFEHWMDKEFEQPAQEAIQLVVEEGRMTPDHWKRLERFALAQDVRTPAKLRSFIKRQNETLPKVLNDTLESSTKRLERLAAQGNLPTSTLNSTSRLLKHTPSNYLPIRLSLEKQSDGTGRISAEATVGRRMWIWQMKHLLTETIQKLPKHHWTILHAPDGLSWPTSDDPLIKLNYQSPENYNFNGGWGNKNGDILLPLSPKHLLYTSIGNKPFLRGTTVATPFYHQLRKIIIEHADRYIFSLTQFDVDRIRSRLVCAKTYQEEEANWGRWSHEQSLAERKDNDWNSGAS